MQLFQLTAARDYVLVDEIMHLIAFKRTFTACLPILCNWSRSIPTENLSKLLVF